eukprot:CAMPEP_0182580754 /NCGR_PEP_ID=MMETSP1324-20130603/48019_1 /TAXON_ID=236786 /ORGANISM="Florenciella sp., Strain RCC1587" /LENGTH=100 /DNA_ID=CAMNT_0024797031 /DNA_START=45 /DNA_END=343 /DNA_ORIENTATION=+
MPLPASIGPACESELEAVSKLVHRGVLGQPQRTKLAGEVAFHLHRHGLRPPCDVPIGIMARPGDRYGQAMLAPRRRSLHAADHAYIAFGPLARLPLATRR